MTIELPGLFDLQVNGFGGIDFNAPALTADRVVEALERMRATGVTRCLPTLITSSFERVRRERARAGAAGRSGDRGHPHGRARTCRRTTARAARIRARTRACRRASTTSTAGRTPPADGSCWSRWRPRCPARCPLIEHLVAAGVRVAIGHTAATPRQIGDAICGRRDARDASRQRLRADAAAASECDLGAARRRRRPREPDRRRPPPAAVDGEGDGPRQGSGADDSRHRRDRRRRLRARTVYDRRRRVRPWATTAACRCRARRIWRGRA